LALSKGVGQAAVDAITAITNPATGALPGLLTSITSENKDISTQITAQQTMLTNMQNSLEAQYSTMEATLAQLQAAGQSIGTLS
jgi:flagellar capping protein FliD